MPEKVVEWNFGILHPLV